MKQKRQKHIIFVGADHEGFYLKESLKQLLARKGIEVIDCGNDAFDANDDYPDFAARVAEKVVAKKAMGILICDSGVGMAIAANRFPGVRALNAWNESHVISSRHDDNTNILCLGAGTMTAHRAERLIFSWLETPFGRAPRYTRRLKKIESLMKKRT
jgi:ribose 5-phosphate isomerase B